MTTLPPVRARVSQRRLQDVAHRDRNQGDQPVPAGIAGISLAKEPDICIFGVFPVRIGASGNPAVVDDKRIRAINGREVDAAHKLLYESLHGRWCGLTATWKDEGKMRGKMRGKDEGEKCPGISNTCSFWTPN